MYAVFFYARVAKRWGKSSWTGCNLNRWIKCAFEVIWSHLDCTLCKLWQLNVTEHLNTVWLVIVTTFLVTQVTATLQQPNEKKWRQSHLSILNSESFVFFFLRKKSCFASNGNFSLMNNQNLPESMEFSEFVNLFALFFGLILIISY